MEAGTMEIQNRFHSINEVLFNSWNHKKFKIDFHRILRPGNHIQSGYRLRLHIHSVHHTLGLGTQENLVKDLLRQHTTDDALVCTAIKESQVILAEDVDLSERAYVSLRLMKGGIIYRNSSISFLMSLTVLWC